MRDSSMRWFGYHESNSSREQSFCSFVGNCQAMENSFKRDLRNYPLYFLLWTVLGLFYFSQGLTQRLVSHDPTPWWRYLVAWLLGAYIWALLTPAIFWFGRRFP